MLLVEGYKRIAVNVTDEVEENEDGETEGDLEEESEAEYGNSEGDEEDGKSEVEEADCNSEVVEPTGDAEMKLCSTVEDCSESEFRIQRQPSTSSKQYSKIDDDSANVSGDMFESDV